MKFLLLLLFSGSLLVTMAQKPQFKVYHLSLPQELAYFDNQFSGLYIHNGKLFVLSESRLQEGAEGKLYAINLSDLDRKINDTTYVLPYQKYHLYHLEKLQDQMARAGQNYEGLEAITMEGSQVVLSVETDTPSSACYLITGQLNDTAVVLDTTFLLPIKKPVTVDGAHIYNAGFEAVAQKDQHIYAFFEYNYFPAHNYVYQLDKQFLSNSSHPQLLPMQRLPFRVTDITEAGKGHFTAINYFFKGEGGDTVYRTPASDQRSGKLITGGAGYKNYCRLIDIQWKHHRFTWKPLWDFPELYLGYNWEGIAAYKSGYFIVNDKYTAHRPYSSTLLYIKKAK